MYKDGTRVSTLGAGRASSFALSGVFSLLSVLDSHHHCFTALCLACHDGGNFVMSVTIRTAMGLFFLIKKR